jgi:hypothetical protein
MLLPSEVKVAPVPLCWNPMPLKVDLLFETARWEAVPAPFYSE